MKKRTDMKGATSWNIENRTGTVPVFTHETTTKEDLHRESGSANQKTPEAEPCACCALFFGDYAVQELERCWDNPRGLRALIKELLEEGFGHFAKPALWRWRRLVPSGRDYHDLRSRADEQTWVTGSSKTIHDIMRPMTDPDIERAVAHDLALMQRQWDKNAEEERQLKKSQDETRKR